MKRVIGAALLISVLASCGERDKEPAKPLETAAATSVRVVQVAEAVVQPWIYAQGTARAVRREFLTFPTAGRIAYVDPDLKVGDPVRRGQIIAYQQPDRAQAEVANARAGVSNSRGDLAVARAAQREARANLDLARETFERYRILLAQRSASRQEFEEAEAKLASAKAAKAKADAQIEAIEAGGRASDAQLDQARVTAAESRIVSPIDGILARLNIEQGYYFSPQTVQSSSEQGALSTIPVFIIDPSAFEVAVDLPAYHFGSLKVDAKALLNPPDYKGTGTAGTAPDAAGANALNKSGNATPPDAAVQGKVWSITPSIDPEKRTFQVKVRTQNPTDRVHDGEFVSVWIAGDKPAAAPVVPFDALRYVDGSPFLFILDRATSKVVRRDVKLGARGADSQSIVKGLEAGEWVVTEGRAGLSDGDRVKPIGDTAVVPAKSR